MKKRNSKGQFDKNENSKTTRAAIRLRPEESKYLKEQAGLAGLTMSSYLRQITLGNQVIAKGDLSVIKELSRLGNLMKYLTKAKVIFPAERDQVLAELIAAIKRLGAKS